MSSANRDVTYSDIAKKLGIAVSTVSRAINNSGEVSKKTRQAVLEEANRMNYTPNETARNLATKTNNTIAAIIPDIMNPYYSEVIKSLEAVLVKNNFALLLCITNESDVMMDYYLNELLKKRVSGIILLSACVKNQALLEKIKRNTVLVGISTSHTDIDQVECRERESTYQAIRHLIELHHQRIAFIGYKLQDNQVLACRLQGYKDALLEAGIPVDPALIIDGAPLNHPGEAEMERLLTLPEGERPTAVHCMNEYIALGAYSRIKERGLSIPEDISFSAQDGLHISHIMYPKLTTVMTPISAMAEAAVELVLQRIKFGKKEETQTILFNHRFVIGESTRPL